MEAGLVAKEAAQLAMRREDARYAHTETLRLLPEVMEEFIGQPVHLEERAKLGVRHTLLGHEPEKPFVAVTIFHGVGLDAEMEGEIGHVELGA